MEIVDYDTAIKNVKQITSLDKTRLGYRPEEGQNQWTRNCQNSGNDKKRRPNIISEDQLDKLLKMGYKFNKDNGFYEKEVEIKTRGKTNKVTIKAVKLKLIMVNSIILHVTQKKIKIICILVFI